MKIVGGIDELPSGLRFAVTIGMFDGVHRGHQRAVRTLVAVAREFRASAVVLTFDPHPATVLRGTPPPTLLSPAEKMARLAALGTDVIIVQRFDREFAAQPPDLFLARLCANRDLVAVVMTGESAFGRDRVGIFTEVKRLGAEMRFRVVEVKRLESDGLNLSSTRLRGLLAAGRLSDVRRLLGRRYAVVGKVVKGDQRGRTLSFPTANLAFDSPVALPIDGVYAVKVGWGLRDPLEPVHVADGVASLGIRPTFGADGQRLLEVHVFDFAGDLYGKEMRVEFVRRIRAEKKFDSNSALVSQMTLDAARARSILSDSTTGAPGRSRPAR